MTFQSLGYAIDGWQQTGQLWRLAFEAATLDTPGGVVAGLDCIVSQTASPSANVSIADGKFVIAGQEVADQGNYYGYNVGADTTVSIAPTTGTPRSDMVVARAEDPTFSGSPWGTAVNSQVIFPRVISGVSSTATQPPAGQSAIPLARIDMPATASTVLQSYITDLRQTANPKRQRTILQAAGGASPVSWTVSTSPTAWPPTATWSVAIPSWATWVKMKWLLVNTVYIAGGNAFARGFVYPVFGSSVSSPNQSFPQSLVSIQNAVTFEVMAVGGSADTSVSTSLRGTTQTLQFAQKTDGTNTGVVEVTEGSLYIVDVEFSQQAVTS